MKQLSQLNKTLLEKMDPELQAAAKAIRIQKLFARAIQESCHDSKAAHYILERIQAVYLMSDYVPTKNNPNKKRVVLRIYSNDSAVRAEIDARQEWIRMSLAKRNVFFDKLVIYASSFGMKQRKPYAGLLNNRNTQEDIERHSLAEKEIENLAKKISNPRLSSCFEAACKASSKKTT